MFDVLVYLFESYYQADSYPDHETLARKLTAAGFENDDIHEALDWLEGLAANDAGMPADSLEASIGIRAYADLELRKLSTESRGFLVFLESAGVLSPVLREIIIERTMALPDDTVELDKLKVIALMVLWTQRGDVDTLLLEELLPPDVPQYAH